jgi:hypothetical protein
MPEGTRILRSSLSETSHGQLHHSLQTEASQMDATGVWPWDSLGIFPGKRPGTAQRGWIDFSSAGHGTCNYGSLLTSNPGGEGRQEKLSHGGRSCHPHHRWLGGAIQNRLREELAKIQVPVRRYRPESKATPA